jgi:hypothetical protein
MAQLDNKFPTLPPGRYDGFTVYVRNGKPIVRRSRNDKGNPSKSLVQSAARLRWNNVQRLWGTFPKEWRPRYQNRAVGCCNYNTFMSLNMHDTPIYLTKQEVENYASVLVPLVVSHGILKEIAVVLDSQGLISDIKVGRFTITPQTTVGQFAKAIVSHNRDYCNGDQLTFVLGRQTMDAYAPRASFVCHTVTLDLFSEQPLAEAVGDSDGFEVRNGMLASHVVSGAATWVHERPTTDGEPLVSTQRLWCENSGYIARYTSPEALERAAESYGKGKASMLTPDPTMDEQAGRL